MSNKEAIKKKIQEVISDSAQTSKSYRFENGKPITTNNVGMSKWISKEILEVENCINNLEEKHNLKSVCKKGCAECCKQCIVVLSSECPAIEAHLYNMDTHQRDDIKRKTLELCSILNENGITNAKINNFFEIKNQQKIQEEYFDLKQPCIFLNENNECIIHPVRPSLCWSYREYFDPENCKISCFSETSIKYDDWEARTNKRLISVRTTHAKIKLLPFAIKEMMHW